MVFVLKIVGEFDDSAVEGHGLYRGAGGRQVCSAYYKSKAENKVRPYLLIAIIRSCLFGHTIEQCNIEVPMFLTSHIAGQI